MVLCGEGGQRVAVSSGGCGLTTPRRTTGICLQGTHGPPTTDHRQPLPRPLSGQPAARVEKAHGSTMHILMA